MNKGQEMFYDFFMERAKDDKKEEAKALLEDSFARQAAGTFNLEYLSELQPKMFEVVKPEAIEELKQAMSHFASTM